MKTTCENCPKHPDCESFCDKIKKQLEKLSVKSREEISISSMTPINNNGDISIDDVRNIDRGRIFDDVNDLQINWDSEVYPLVNDFEDKELKVLMEHIDRAIPRHKKQQKARFKAFIRCSTITRIAKLANTSDSNIHKQFYLIIKKIHKLMSPDKVPMVKTITPYQFKLKLI